MLDVVFPVQSRDVRASQSLSTVKAQQVESLEIVGLAERVLTGRLVGHGKELGGDDFTAILQRVSDGTRIKQSTTEAAGLSTTACCSINSPQRSSAPGTKSYVRDM